MKNSRTCRLDFVINDFLNTFRNVFSFCWLLKVTFARGVVVWEGQDGIVFTCMSLSLSLSFLASWMRTSPIDSKANYMCGSGVQYKFQAVDCITARRLFQSWRHGLAMANSLSVLHAFSCMCISAQHVSVSMFLHHLRF